MLFLAQLTDKQIQDAIVKGIKQANPNDITSNQFLIFSLALALSTYVSAVSREVATSLKRDIKQARRENIRKKKNFLACLILGDLFLWCILAPIVINILFYWFPNTLQTQSPQWIKYLHWGIAIFIGVAALYMFCLHIAQAIEQRSLFFEGIRGNGNTFASLSEEYQARIKEILKRATSPQAQGKLSEDAVTVYLELAASRQTEDGNVLITDQELIKNTGLDETRLNNAIQELERSDNWLHLKIEKDIKKYTLS